MESKAMKILIIEDDIDDCNRFVNCIKERKDIELVGITDSDTEGLKYVKLKHYRFKIDMSQEDWK